ncbi:MULTISPECIES: hypothetical protein, partial [unclassified Rhizobium]|uniref:hypothetical protein n=1 Tax=unclassified Rhizobium TaxID=2613769 RepID=UPI001AD9EB98
GPTRPLKKPHNGSSRDIYRGSAGNCRYFRSLLKIWASPAKTETAQLVAKEDASTLPAEGTVCKFTYAGKQYDGQIQGAHLVVRKRSANAFLSEGGG